MRDVKLILDGTPSPTATNAEALPWYITLVTARVP